MGLSFLCIATFFKGNEFLKSCKQAGNTVYLLTEKKLEHKPWARDFIDEIFFVDTPAGQELNLEETAKGFAHMLRSRRVDRVVALDDFDVEKAAFFREVFRFPGMGQTQARYFRDKLAMRVKAAEAGLRIPAFSALFHDETITAFAESHAFPMVVKPRGEASTTGIRKVWSKDELWQVVHSLGDRRHEYLVEQFKPGDVYHVDALTAAGKVVFSRASRYLSTPMEVAHGGGIFRSATLETGSDEEAPLLDFNEKLLMAFGLEDSASHTEFIRCHEDGEWYFLETASRVGGAHLAEMVEAATGINLWREWARLETAAAKGLPYDLPPVRPMHAGIVISLVKEARPDLSGYEAPELWWRMDEEFHIGLIVQSDSRQRIGELLDTYAEKIARESHTSAPVRDRPTH